MLLLTPGCGFSFQSVHRSCHKQRSTQCCYLHLGADFLFNLCTDPVISSVGNCKAVGTEIGTKGDCVRAAAALKLGLGLTPTIEGILVQQRPRGCYFKLSELAAFPLK